MNIEMKEFKFMSQRNHGSIFGNAQANPKPVEKNNKSSWHVNEHVKHNKFGLGKIIEIVGDILVIDFILFESIKKLLVLLF